MLRSIILFICNLFIVLAPFLTFFLTDFSSKYLTAALLLQKNSWIRQKHGLIFVVQLFLDFHALAIKR